MTIAEFNAINTLDVVYIEVYEQLKADLDDNI